MNLKVPRAAAHEAHLLLLSISMARVLFFDEKSGTTTDTGEVEHIEQVEQQEGTRKDLLLLTFTSRKKREEWWWQE